MKWFYHKKLLFHITKIQSWFHKIKLKKINNLQTEFEKKYSYCIHRYNEQHKQFTSDV